MNAFAWALLLTSSLRYLFFATGGKRCLRTCVPARLPA